MTKKQQENSTYREEFSDTSHMVTIKNPSECFQFSQAEWEPEKPWMCYHSETVPANKFRPRRRVKK